MFRILKVSHLEERRRVLVARSEIHRRTLQVEVAQVRYSVSLLKQRFAPLRMARHVWRFSIPLLRMMLARNRPRGDGEGIGLGQRLAGFIASVLSGIRLVESLMPLFRKREAAQEQKPVAGQEESRGP